MAEVTFKNQSGKRVEFCCGESEHVLETEEQVKINVKDGDCVYFDYIGDRLV